MVQLDNNLRATSQVPAGLPQDSSILPILFILFIQPLFSLGNRGCRRARLDYTNDIALLATSKSLEENNNILENNFKNITEWA